MRRESGHCRCSTKGVPHRQRRRPVRPPCRSLVATAGGRHHAVAAPATAAFGNGNNRGGGGTRPQRRAHDRKMCSHSNATSQRVIVMGDYGCMRRTSGLCGRHGPARGTEALPSRLRRQTGRPQRHRSVRSNCRRRRPAAAITIAVSSGGSDVRRRPNDSHVTGGVADGGVPNLGAPAVTAPLPSQPAPRRPPPLPPPRPPPSRTDHVANRSTHKWIERRAHWSGNYN